MNNKTLTKDITLYQYNSQVLCEQRFVWRDHVRIPARSYNGTLGGFDETKSKINRRGFCNRT